MAEASKDPDQSMEDILQSIKRIIADEGDAVPTPPPGSEVLELTELLEEDAAPPALHVAEPAPADLSSLSVDDIMNMPMDALQPPAAPEPVPMPEPVPAAPVAAPAPEPAPAPSHAEAIAAHDTGPLMSEATVSASVAALEALKHTPQALNTDHVAFRSGATVEDLVIEALKPMLKEWLDGNLPQLVRALVEKEIRRLTS